MFSRMEENRKKENERGRESCFPYSVSYERKEGGPKSNLLFGKREKCMKKKILIV